MNIYLATRSCTRLDEYSGFVVVARDVDEAKNLVDARVDAENYKKDFDYFTVGKYIGEETDGHILLESFIAG